MIDPAVRAAYKATIGIECHVQLKTATKLFDAVGNDAREAEPNTLIGPLSFGLPGALPVRRAQVSAAHWSEAIAALHAMIARGDADMAYTQARRIVQGLRYIYPQLREN